MKEKKQEKGPLIVAAVLVGILIFSVIMLLIQLSKRVESGMEAWKEQKVAEEERKEPTKTPTKAPTSAPTNVPTKAPISTPTEAPAEEGYVLKRVSYEVVDKITEDTFLIWKNDGYGVINAEGTYLIEPQYPYVEYYDEEWISFSDDYNIGYVHDQTGELLYTYDYYVSGLVSETGSLYDVFTCYQKGMKIETILGNGEESYYGARYYNAETGALIFEAVGSHEEIAMHAFPDETGMAVVVQDGESEIIINRITKDGVTTDSRWYFDVAERGFYYSDYANWTRQTLSEGWLVTTLGEKAEAGAEEVTWVQALYDVNNFVLMPLPEQYQDAYAHIYREMKGKYYGIATLTYEEYIGELPETMNYAVCYGNQVLTEELYSWISFEENYILAGSTSGAHILNYEGEVIKEFEDMAPRFVNGTLVVCDDQGVYLLDENLEPCSGILATNVNYCMPNFVWKGLSGYLILDESK